MPRHIGGIWMLVLTGLISAGCNQNPYVAQQQTAAWQQQQQYQAQLYDLNRRTTELDANNADLHTKLAQSRQQVDLLRGELGLVQKQLGDTAKQLQDAQLAKKESDQKYQDLLASTRTRGGAIITANSSVAQTLRKVEIPNVDVRQDGDLIRIELPSDQLFAPGTAQLVGSAFPILDAVAAEIARSYPKQKIAIEGHTDPSPPYGGISTHQVASAQAMAVFEQFTRRNRLPAKNLFVIAQGPNQPLTSNGTEAGRAKNRRVELVIYPETVEP